MSRKGLYTYLALGFLVIVGLTYSEMNKPRPVNWRDSFSKNHHIPFGCMVFYEQMQSFFGERWRMNAEATYEWLNRNDSLTGTAYLLINRDLNLDDATNHALYEYAARGNDVLLSSVYPNYGLMDTLGIHIDWLGYGYFSEDTVSRRLVNPRLPRARTQDVEGSHYRANYFIDSLTVPGTRVLGVVESEEWEHQEINFVRVPVGNGAIYVHLFPYAFTNYTLLREGEEHYAAGVSSYFADAHAIYWDEYEKIGRSEYTTPLYIFFSNRSFQWAYYLVIAGVVMYVLLQGKRKQRAIPVVEPLENQSVNFTRTLGDMYLDGSNNREIVEMKWEHFTEHIRSQLFLSTENLDEAFFRQLSARSNQDISELKAFLNWFNKLRKNDSVSGKELIELDQKIQSFKEKTHGKF